MILQSQERLSWTPRRKGGLPHETGYHGIGDAKTKLFGERRDDVCVVGGGTAGLMAAYGALENGASRIIVCEKADTRASIS